MPEPVWAKVRRELGFNPRSEGRIGGSCPIHLEHWVYQARTVRLSGVGCPVLLTQLGGAPVREGEDENCRLSVLPSQSALMPPHTPTRWHYSGAVDDLAVYLLEPRSGVQRRLADLVAMDGTPLHFADGLVAAAAQEISNELDGGVGGDGEFIARLACVMLEQVVRVLTGSNAPRIRLPHVHYVRLQKVLGHISANLAGELSIGKLAALAELSEAHFRRVFLEAVGQPAHRYVLNRRIEQARRLLAFSDVPIALIADECGFHGQSHLTRCFREAYAITPAAYRRETNRVADA